MAYAALNDFACSQSQPNHLIDHAGNTALREQVRHSVQRYLHTVDGQARNIYALMLEEMEIGLFSEILSYCRGNQSRASEMLGIHRATLRKKLRDLNLL